MILYFKYVDELSTYAKYVLLRLILSTQVEGYLVKLDFIKLGCPKNKLLPVIKELLEFKVLVVQEESLHKNRGRPIITYRFERSNTKCLLDKLALLPCDIEKIVELKMRIPTQLVWFFLVLSADEFGYVESVSMAKIAKACGLKIVEVKTAIKQLSNANLLSQPVKGCTIKKYNSEIPKEIKDSIGSEANNLKRCSTFKINNDKETHAIYLITLPSINNRKLNSFTTIFLPLLRDRPLKNDSLFMELLHFENKWLDSSPKQYDEIEFLMQQPPQVFDHFDDVLFKLASYGLLRLLNKTISVLNPISEEDAFNQILSPANFEFMAAIHGRFTSELIGHFANILVHYILYTFYQHRCDMNLPVTPDKREYLSWITSLNFINKNIDIELIRTPSKVTLPDISSLDNLVISSNIDLSDKVKIIKNSVDFKHPKSHLKNSEYPVFQCVPDSFARFYKTVITSE
ncbi:hypothetical protein RC083_02700 [Pseudoalteromonas haloplanktis]|uniref:Uncharacterized protein n=1 Tax=Pseudoalteromonas haloplanktis TaxID=228 RepID=A0ABU1B7H9_PSEHA|nr:hypothetical protein [Pseudoalteromonas haloplanktis]MDQ9090498.1 hypothetical protein [Pseudoalteromonas haloplanktis]